MFTSTDLNTRTWRASSYSNGDGGNCVEVADGFPGLIPVRDSKDPSGAVLAFGAAHWTPFVQALRDGALR